MNFENDSQVPSHPVATAADLLSIESERSLQEQHPPLVHHTIKAGKRSHSPVVDPDWLVTTVSIETPFARSSTHEVPLCTYM